MDKLSYCNTSTTNMTLSQVRYPCPLPPFIPPVYRGIQGRIKKLSQDVLMKDVHAKGGDREKKYCKGNHHEPKAHKRAKKYTTIPLLLPFSEEKFSRPLGNWVRGILMSILYKKISGIIFGLMVFFSMGLASLLAEDLSDKEYIIGPEDVIAIQVWDNEDLNCATEVSLEGAFTFPFIGRVLAGGLSVTELENLIETRLSDGYLISPHVNVSIKEYKSQKVSILGAVKNPGSYTLKRKTDILELISQAGGFAGNAGQIITIVRPESLAQHNRNQFAAVNSPSSQGGEFVVSAQPSNEGEVKIDNKKKFVQGNMIQQNEHRTNSGKERENEIITLDLSDFKANSAYNNFYVKNGDSIFVNQAPQVFVSGEVKKPGEFPWEKGLTVRQAISRAGGPTDNASPRRVIVIRVEAGKEKELKPRMDDLVVPGDVVKVPGRYF